MYGKKEVEKKSKEHKKLSEYINVKNIVKVCVSLFILIFLTLFGISHVWKTTETGTQYDPSRPDNNFAGSYEETYQNTLLQDPPITVFFIIFMLILVAFFALAIYYEATSGNFLLDEITYSDDKLPSILVVGVVISLVLFNIIQSLAFDQSIYILLGFGSLSLIGIGVYFLTSFILEVVYY